MQVMTNRRKDATAATWIYFDEIHVLLKDPMSSNFLYSSWKRFRKYNAYATGISQDIQDYLDNPVAYLVQQNSNSFPVAAPEMQIAFGFVPSYHQRSVRSFPKQSSRHPTS